MVDPLSDQDQETHATKTERNKLTNPSGGQRIGPSSRPSSSPCSPCSFPQDPVRWAEQERSAHREQVSRRAGSQAGRMTCQVSGQQVDQWTVEFDRSVCVVVVTCGGVGEKQEMHQKCNRKHNKERERQVNHSGSESENKRETRTVEVTRDTSSENAK